MSGFPLLPRDLLIMYLPYLPADTEGRACPEVTKGISVVHLSAAPGAGPGSARRGYWFIFRERRLKKERCLIVLFFLCSFFFLVCVVLRILS